MRHVFASISNGDVAHYRADGTFLDTYNIGDTGFTTGMAFDVDDNLYVTGFGVGKLAKFDNFGTLIDPDFASGLSRPESVVFDSSGNLYVGDLDVGIRKYDSSGSFIGTVIDTRVDWFDLSADQSFFVYGQESINIPTVSNAIPGVPGPDFVAPGGTVQAFAMRFLDDGGLLVADRDDVKRFDSAGTQTQSYDLPGEDVWFALNLDPDETSFWSGGVDTGMLHKFDIDTGTLLQTIDTGVEAFNLFGVTVFGEITVAVDPPVVDDAMTTATVGDMVLHIFTGSDPNGDPLTWSFESFAGPDPPAVAPTFNPGTQEFEWDTTGSVPGTYFADVRATDPGGLLDIGTLQIQVIPEPTGTALCILGLWGLGHFSRHRRSIGLIS